jgi:uncharacterized protein YqfB (UPF0267 family)
MFPMVAYNFQARFAYDVASGRKRQTIRANSKRRHARPGETIQLYTEMRRTTCKQLGLGTCLSAEPCRITVGAVFLGKQRVESLDEFAQADGFPDFTAMKEWFAETHGLPFNGTLIKWEPKIMAPPGGNPCLFR